mmetsp:Transcript_14089/g.39610  ORF Transcript_14089/g.39610 Transcript_14089/m.39610 type:complete len:215 (+) Transcript_14089:632-1276(+)
MWLPLPRLQHSSWWARSSLGLRRRRAQRRTHRSLVATVRACPSMRSMRSSATVPSACIYHKQSKTAPSSFGRCRAWAPSPSRRSPTQMVTFSASSRPTHSVAAGWTLASRPTSARSPTRPAARSAVLRSRWPSAMLQPSPSCRPPTSRAAPSSRQRLRRRPRRRAPRAATSSPRSRQSRSALLTTWWPCRATSSTSLPRARRCLVRCCKCSRVS